MTHQVCNQVCNQVCKICYNEKRIKRFINCPFCNDTACSDCWKQFLLSINTDSLCMFCNKFFLYENLVDMFPKVFISGDLRKHQEIIIFERDKTYLPNAQAYITIINDIKKYLETIVRD